MGNITITEEQKKYIISLIDKYISMHREINNSYCKYPGKMADSTCESNCDACFNNYYVEMKEKMIHKAGLEG